MGFYEVYKQFLCCFVLVYLATDAMSRENESCYANNSNPYIYTGAKTAYQFVHNNVTERITLPNCKPKYIWMYCRHGTRYPGQNTISDLTHIRDLILDNHKIRKQGYLCDQDLRNLENWIPNDSIQPQYHKYLTPQGKKDLRTLGERLKIRFPEFFGAKKPKNYEFKSTNTHRTINSMLSFISGAFDHDFTPNVQVDALMSESVMFEMFRTCQPRLDEMNSTRANEQVQKFLDGPEMMKLVADVSRRLGFAENMNKVDIIRLYDMCRFEKAWYPDKLSPWCAAFTDDEMRVFEYEEDLFFYYNVGHGLKINKQFGCRTMLEMIDRFAKLEHSEDTDEPKGSFYFSHSMQAMLFFTSMGIREDSVPLTFSNYRDMANRKWRTSLLSPFATNLVAVFYRCESEDSPFKVAFYLGEHPVTLEGCKDGVCDWTKLKATLGLVAKNCDIKFCQPESKYSLIL